MGRRITGIVVLVAVLISGYLLWKRHSVLLEAANGDVHCDGCMTPAEHARFLKENAGETADGASDHKNKTAREEAATDFQDAPQDTDGGRGDASMTSTPGAPSSSGSPVQGSEPRTPAFPLPSHAGTAPADTLSANAQNGVRFGGSGSFQWYRQGNITWRLDTATGRSCIIYATMEEWHKSIVLSHGCGRNA